MSIGRAESGSRVGKFAKIWQDVLNTIVPIPIQLFNSQFNYALTSLLALHAYQFQDPNRLVSDITCLLKWVYDSLYQ